ncbi:MAG TPA: glycosyltransferase family 25 protein [Verrucomicrobiae bacterium]|nr:glycosyltransferase family 25 protein [Verrucomicrobiae bacterium]
MNPFKTGAIEAVYVIHARKFADRAAHMKRLLGRLEIPYEIIAPYDADMLDAATKNRFLSPANSHSDGENSCTLKHFEAWRRIAERNQRLVLILEDDVVVAENFIEELGEIVEEAQQLAPPYTIQIGCANNMYVPRKTLVPGKHLYLSGEVRATDAYLIGAETARRRLGWLDHNRIHLPPDHLCTFIDGQQKTPIYWSDPTLVEQGSMNGLFPSELDRRRKSRPLWYLKVRFWWQRLRKKYIYRLFR